LTRTGLGIPIPLVTAQRGLTRHGRTPPSRDSGLVVRGASWRSPLLLSQLNKTR
jgi:hypothetical protein